MAATKASKQKGDLKAAVREAVAELGLDISYKDAAAWVSKHKDGLHLTDKSFWRIRGELRKENAGQRQTALPVPAGSEHEVSDHLRQMQEPSNLPANDPSFVIRTASLAKLLILRMGGKDKAKELIDVIGIQDS